ncbi:unnamed protein product [Danaus chrysippus]|uniref:(African queen) hypothetical protein n=1 Tax=Danaus chrysippus TaxID=151541 RepID=A0A8J2W2M6_9NEOP|nr:unnamed protein product [Danaus chrysippus]
MYTLKGIFPEPKKEQKKNFIKENMKQLKMIQGKSPKEPKFTLKSVHPPHLNTQAASSALGQVRSSPSNKSGKVTLNVGKTSSSNSRKETQRNTNKERRYGRVPQEKRNETNEAAGRRIGRKKILTYHQATRRVYFQNICVNVKKSERSWTRPVSKEEHAVCPPGHVTLPDNERKETLRMLRNKLVSELNKMPVKTDTLRMRNRKMELEKQLAKLEEGIKVFSRPKVFVKIGE